MLQKGPPENQAKFNDIQLNTLLIKIIGFYLKGVTYSDAHAAEHACFSLYLSSQNGFQVSFASLRECWRPSLAKHCVLVVPPVQSCFLPESLGNGYNSRSLVAKILSRFKDSSGASPSVCHAAKQLLLRLKFLVFEDPASIRDPHGRGIVTDFSFDTGFVEPYQNIDLAQKVHSGAKPRADILHRPICKRQS